MYSFYVAGMKILNMIFLLIHWSSPSEYSLQFLILPELVIIPKDAKGNLQERPHSYLYKQKRWKLHSKNDKQHPKSHPSKSSSNQTRVVYMLSLPSSLMCDPAESLFNRSRFERSQMQATSQVIFCVENNMFSDAVIAKTIRVHNTFVLHRIPPKDSNQENWSSTHFYWFKSPTWSHKSLSGEVWTPVQALNMASNRGTIVEMSVFKGFKVWSLSEWIVLFRCCRRGTYYIVLPGEGTFEKRQQAYS